MSAAPTSSRLIDKKCYFRLNPDLSFSNHSACGNDIKTESPMMRKLIVDTIRYYMEEFHVDGFRLDLAELIDMQTMLDIRDTARAINPKAILISEPWSPGRGENKYQLRGTGWSAWNNDFRYAAKDFARGAGNREWLQNSLFGSVNTWAHESAAAGELSGKPRRHGVHRRNHHQSRPRRAQAERTATRR